MWGGGCYLHVNIFFGGEIFSGGLRNFRGGVEKISGRLRNFRGGGGGGWEISGGLRLFREGLRFFREELWFFREWLRFPWDGLRFFWKGLTFFREELRFFRGGREILKRDRDSSGVFEKNSGELRIYPTFLKKYFEHSPPPPPSVVRHGRISSIYLFVWSFNTDILITLKYSDYSHAKDKV